MRILQSWTPKRLTRLRQLWETGLDNEQLADAMQTTSAAIMNILKRHRMVRPDAWPPERTERFKQLWADDSLTAYEIAKAIGLGHHASVSHRAAARGCRRGWRARHGPRRKKSSSGSYGRKVTERRASANYLIALTIAL